MNFFEHLVWFTLSLYVSLGAVISPALVSEARSRQRLPEVKTDPITGLFPALG